MNRPRAACFTLLGILLGLASSGCERKSTQQTQVTTISVMTEIKAKTGVALPQLSSLIKFGPEPHSDVDMWLFKLNGTNAAQYPKQLNKLFIGSEAVSQAALLERTGHISIQDPTACYFGVWDWTGVQVHATLVTTTADGSYLMIERYDVNVQQSRSSTTNK